MSRNRLFSITGYLFEMGFILATINHFHKLAEVCLKIAIS